MAEIFVVLFIFLCSLRALNGSQAWLGLQLTVSCPVTFSIDIVILSLTLLPTYVILNYMFMVFFFCYIVKIFCNQTLQDKSIGVGIDVDISSTSNYLVSD